MKREELIAKLKSRWIDKFELMEMLDCNDRDVRARMEELNQSLVKDGLCVLSTSRHYGYHIPNPKSTEDLSLTKSAVLELESKAKALLYKRKAFVSFLRHYAEDCKTLSLFVEE